MQELRSNARLGGHSSLPELAFQALPQDGMAATPDTCVFVRIFRLQQNRRMPRFYLSTSETGTRRDFNARRG